MECLRCSEYNMISTPRLFRFSKQKSGLKHHAKTQTTIFGFEVEIKLYEVGIGSSTRVSESYLLALGTTQISSYFTKHSTKFFNSSDRELPRDMLGIGNTSKQTSYIRDVG